MRFILATVLGIGMGALVYFTSPYLGAKAQTPGAIIGAAFFSAFVMEILCSKNKAEKKGGGKTKEPFSF